MRAQKFGRASSIAQALAYIVYARKATVWSFQMINWAKWNWNRLASKLAFADAPLLLLVFDFYLFFLREINGKLSRFKFYKVAHCSDSNFSFRHEDRWLTPMSVAIAVDDCEWEQWCSFTYQSEWTNENYRTLRVNYNNDSLATATHLCHARLDCSSWKRCAAVCVRFSTSSSCFIVWNVRDSSQRSMHPLPFASRVQCSSVHRNTCAIPNRMVTWIFGCSTRNSERN